MAHVEWIGCGRAPQVREEQGKADWDGGGERVPLMSVSGTGRERDQQWQSSRDAGRWAGTRKRWKGGKRKCRPVCQHACAWILTRQRRQTVGGRAVRLQLNHSCGMVCEVGSSQ
jgi:hypothetical protein